MSNGFKLLRACNEVEVIILELKNLPHIILNVQNMCGR